MGPDETALPPDVWKVSDLPRNTRNVMELRPTSPFDPININLQRLIIQRASMSNPGA